MLATTPTSIDENTRRLMLKLPDASEPVFLPLMPEPYALVSECFANVREKTRRDGGAVQHGWCVWLAPEVLIEGEFHAVWKSPNEELIDITPKPEGETRILFIPDNVTKYNNVHVDNIRLILEDSPGLQQVLALHHQRMKLLHRYNDGSGQAIIPIDELGEGLHVPGLRPRRNDLCPCGSGKKFKRCCMRP